MFGYLQNAAAMLKHVAMEGKATLLELCGSVYAKDVRTKVTHIGKEVRLGNGREILQDIVWGLLPDDRQDRLLHKPNHVFFYSILLTRI